MIMNSSEKSIIGIFATPVAKYTLGRDLSFSEKEFICNQSRNTFSEDLVTQSKNNKILEETSLKDLKNFLEKALNDFFQETVKPSTNVCLKITQSWVNYSSVGREHKTHLHHNSIISGVFYVSTNKDSDKIFFCRKVPYLSYSIEPTQLNEWTTNICGIPSEEGTLLLFPSTLEHGVPSVIEEKERISISFNSFFSGEIGNASHLTQLIV
jgi:uncharacterized protein (TIGR02466 family)